MTLVNKLDARMAHMDELVRRYFGGCNQADSARIAGCLVRDATHYFPPGMYDGPFRGAAAIGARWQSMVEAIGSYWTIDTLLIQPATWHAVMEWTHVKTANGTIQRGIEVYEFDELSGLIREIRAYYAWPQTPDMPRQELGGFDYRARGYAMAPPPGARPKSKDEL